MLREWTFQRTQLPLEQFWYVAELCQKEKEGEKKTWISQASSVREQNSYACLWNLSCEIYADATLDIFWRICVEGWTWKMWCWTHISVSLLGCTHRLAKAFTVDCWMKHMLRVSLVLHAHGLIKIVRSDLRRQKTDHIIFSFHFPGSKSHLL